MGGVFELTINTIRFNKPSLIPHYILIKLPFNRMKRISIWARQNRTYAIILIVFIEMTLATMAVFIGLASFKLGITFQPIVIGLSILVFLITILVYPVKERWRFARQKLYPFQKLCDLSMIICIFTFIAGMTNATSKMSLPVNQAVASFHSNPTATEILESLKYRDKSSLTKAEKRILKAELKKQIKQYVEAKVSGNQKNAGTTALIILTIIGAIGLGAALMALVCSISCGGSEALAVVVAILGLTGIIFGSVLLIKSINRKKKTKKLEAVK